MFYSDTKPAALPFERRAFKVYCCLPGLLSVLLVFVNQVLQFLESGSGLFEMFVIPQELGSNSFMAQRVEWSEVKRSAGGGGGRKEGSRRSLSGWALALDDCVWGGSFNFSALRALAFGIFAVRERQLQHQHPQQQQQQQQQAKRAPPKYATATRDLRSQCNIVVSPSSLGYFLVSFLGSWLLGFALRGICVGLAWLSANCLAN